MTARRDPLRSLAGRALSPAARRLSQCVDQQLDGRDQVAVSRSQFQELANLSRASVTVGTQQCRTLALLAVTAGARDVHTYARSTEWQTLGETEVAQHRARLPRRRRQAA
jgi:hypothetical protein